MSKKLCGVALRRANHWRGVIEGCNANEENIKTLLQKSAGWSCLWYSFEKEELPEHATCPSKERAVVVARSIAREGRGCWLWDAIEHNLSEHEGGERGGGCLLRQNVIQEATDYRIEGPVDADVHGYTIAYIHNYRRRDAAREKLADILIPIAANSKEGWESVIFWSGGGWPPLGYKGRCFYDLEQNWLGEEAMNEEYLAKLRSRGANQVAVMGSKVAVKDVPPGTYLDDGCGCVWRTLSRQEVFAMDRRQGQSLWNSGDNMPYICLVKPGPECLQKICMGRYRYKLGAHGQPVGAKSCCYDPIFTVVPKPPKFDAKATAGSHSDLKKEYARRTWR